jgi:hypothetical protein
MNRLFFALLLFSTVTLKGMDFKQTEKSHLSTLPANAQIKIIEYLYGSKKSGLVKGFGGVLYLGMGNAMPSLIENSGLTPRQIRGALSIAKSVHRQNALLLIPGLIPKINDPNMKAVLQKAHHDYKARK